MKNQKEKPIVSNINGMSRTTHKANKQIDIEKLKALAVRSCPFVVGITLVGLLITTCVLGNRVDSLQLELAVAREPLVIASTPKETGTVTTSNTVENNVVYIEYLEEVITPETLLVDSTIFPTSLVFPDTYIEDSEGFFVNDKESIHIGQLDTAKTHLAWYWEHNPVDTFMADTGMQYIPVTQEQSVANQSIRNNGITVSKQQSFNYGAQLNQIIIQYGSQEVSIISPFEYRDDICTEVLEQIQNGVPVKAYKIGTDTTEKQITINGDTVLLPTQGGLPEDRVNYSRIPLGSALSDNYLYTLTMPTASIVSDLRSTVDVALRTEDYEITEMLKPSLELNATWVHRPMQYIEYMYNGGLRVCVYVVNDQISNMSNVYFIVENDNKFPYLLQYLNTMALNIK